LVLQKYYIPIEYANILDSIFGRFVPKCRFTGTREVFQEKMVNMLAASDSHPQKKSIVSSHPSVTQKKAKVKIKNGIMAAASPFRPFFVRKSSPSPTM
jgi:hypothetical protein